MAEQRELARDLGVSHASAIVVGTIIGSGIFIVPRTMMAAVGSTRMVYLAWIVGGLLSFFGALTYAELGAMKPAAGGEYVYIRDAYGPLPAFLYGWTWFLVAKPASVASVTTGLAEALAGLPRFAFLANDALAYPLHVTWGQLFAIVATLLITGINYIGVRKAGDFQLVFTLLKIAMVIAIAIIGFTWVGGTWGNFHSTYGGAHGGLTGFMIALIAALWAYDGWNDLNMVAGEVRRPERSIPIALIAGVATVAALYVLMNAAIQYVLPAGLVATAKSPASLATQQVLGPVGGAVVTLGIVLSMLVTLNGTIMSGGRIPFAMARDGYFFKTLAEVHPKFRTPAPALLVQAALSVLLLLAAASFQQLLTLAIFAEWLFYMVATSTVFVLRRTEPDAPRSYKTWGYPVVPFLFIVAAAVLLVYSFRENAPYSYWGAGVIAAGAPVFWFFAWRKKNQPSDSHSSQKQA
ncbi:MAG TPA: amino acid permease [Terriglobales bacterium]|nr:amino acid permease [Terriglobales bacterium]